MQRLGKASKLWLTKCGVGLANRPSLLPPEQLAEWAERSGAELCPYEKDMKPSAVLYRAVEYASRKESTADILIADTSGSALHSPKSSGSVSGYLSPPAAKRIHQGVRAVGFAARPSSFSW